MKILDTENWEKLSGGIERFTAEGITNEEQGKVMVEALNKTFSGIEKDRFFKLVADDYVLRQGYVRDY